MSKIKRISFLILCFLFAIGASKVFAASQPEDPKSEIKVFLVLLGDAGKNGRKIGCDDSVLAVKRNVAFIGTPLQGAIQELLAMPEQLKEGGHELENFWKGEKLQLKKATITSGVANIQITGRISVAGVCDEPRIISQIEETAKQFPGVKQVKVTVNGRPLAQVIK